jgi:RNA polymerase sigma-70 factor, ECF subfamily
MNCDVPQLWLEHKQLLRSYIRKRVADEEDAKDIQEEVLMKVYTFCASKSGVRNLNSWLYQIAHNTIVDYYMRKNKLVALGEEMDIEDVETNTVPAEAANFIIPLIQLLPKEYAGPLLLSDIEGIKQQDIAARLNLGLSATKSRIQRGREKLRDLFLECCSIEFNEQGEMVHFDIKPHCVPLQAIKESQAKKI